MQYDDIAYINHHAHAIGWGPSMPRSVFGLEVALPFSLRALLSARASDAPGRTVSRSHPIMERGNGA
jgi:hypothetical protein